MSRLTVVALLASLLGPSALSAQLRLGDSVRLRQSTGMTIEGVFSSADSSAITITAPPPLDPVRVMRSDIASLEQRAGSHTIGRVAGIAGLLAGAVAGAVAGVANGAAAREQDQRNGGLLIPEFPYRALGGVVGALVGGLVGGLVGALVGRIEVEDWETVDVSAAK